MIFLIRLFGQVESNREKSRDFHRRSRIRASNIKELNIMMTDKLSLT